MNTRKCDLCKEAAFVPLPGQVGEKLPPDWQYVFVGDGFRMAICPYCIVVARAVQQATPLEHIPPARSSFAGDVERTQADLAANRPEAKIK